MKAIGILSSLLLFSRASAVQDQRNLQVGSVAALELMNTITDKSITNLSNNLVIDVSSIPGMSSPSFNINAVVSGFVQSVVFGINGNPNYRTENSALYAFCGNSGRDFPACSVLGYGTHTVTATPFSTVDNVRIAGATVSFNITIVRSTAAPVTAAPVTPITTAPVTPTTAAPVAPVDNEANATKVPTKAPAIPVSAATKAPVTVPTKAPANVATKAPVNVPTTAPVAPALPASEGITALELIYTGRVPHVSVMTLAFGRVNVVDLAALGLPSASFNINAVRTGSIVNSVQFSNGQRETALPYAYCGNSGPTYFACGDFAVGSTVTVTVTPYPIAHQQGTPFQPLSTTLKIVQGTKAPRVTATPVRPPVVAPVPTPVSDAPILTAAPVVSSTDPGVAPVSVPAFDAPILTRAPVVSKAPVRTMAPVLSTKAPVIAPVPMPVTKAPVSASANTTSCAIPRFVGEWKGYWAGSKKYPITVAEAQGGLIGNDFVIFSGFKNGYTNVTTETYALDMSNRTATWRRMDNMPVAEGITHIGYVVVGKKAYICGGYRGGSIGPQTDICLIYDHAKAPGTGQWSTFASLPDGGRSGGGMVYDATVNALFYAAGCTRPQPGNIFAVDHTDTWMYKLDDTVAGWKPRAPIPYMGNHISFVTAKDNSGRDRHFFVGGQQGQHEEHGNVKSNFEYDAINDQWIEQAPQLISRGHAAASTRAISCGFIAAGGISNEQGMTADVAYYDIPTNTWTSIGILSNPINTPVCVIRAGWMHCETGWDSGIFSWMRQIVV